MVFTFAPISAACSLNVGDISHQRVVAGHFVEFAALLVATHPHPMLPNARDPRFDDWSALQRALRSGGKHLHRLRASMSRGHIRGLRETGILFELALSLLPNYRPLVRSDSSNLRSISSTR